MVFRMPQKKIIQPNIQINGSNIEFVENFIFLGITINNKLNWNSHINKVTNKISKTVGILNKLRSFLTSDVLQTIYNTLILPHLIYGILAWGRHTNVIHKIQKRAIRIIAASSVGFLPGRKVFLPHEGEKQGRKYFCHSFCHFCRGERAELIKT